MVVGQGVVVTVKPLQNGIFWLLCIFAEVLPTANDDAHKKYKISVLNYKVS